MENVFDYNMTENERNKLIGSNISKDEYIKEADEDRIILDLFIFSWADVTMKKQKITLPGLKTRNIGRQLFAITGEILFLIMRMNFMPRWIKHMKFSRIFSNSFLFR